MFRIFLNPTDEFPQREVWLEADAAYESEDHFWNFVDREDQLVRRIEKSWVKEFEVAADRRKVESRTDSHVARGLNQGGDWFSVTSREPWEGYSLPRSSPQKAS